MSKHIYTYHYTYLLTDTINQKGYIGVHSSDCHPCLDIKYMGSSKYVNEAIKTNPFTKQILTIQHTRKEALADEIFLHELYDIAVNPLYYNAAKQTSTGFDRTGVIMNQETKDKLSIANLGRKHTSETKDKMRGRVISQKTKDKLSIANLGRNGSRYCGQYHTPWGTYSSPSLSHSDKIAYIGLASNTIYHWCKNSGRIIVPPNNMFSEHEFGKTYKQCGFWFDPEKELQTETLVQSFKIFHSPDKSSYHKKYIISKYKNIISKSTINKYFQKPDMIVRQCMISSSPIFNITHVSKTIKQCGFYIEYKSISYERIKSQLAP